MDHISRHPSQLTPERSFEQARLREVFAPPTLSGERIAKKRIPTPESTERAAGWVETITETDPNLKDIIQDRMRQEEVNDPIALLRKDERLRLDVGRYLLQALPNVADLPPRILANSPDNLKNVVEGYHSPKMTSHEYTAVLALSMLDGTFRNQFDPNSIEKNERGDIRDGQHRYAAIQLLHHLAKDRHEPAVDA